MKLQLEMMIEFVELDSVLEEEAEANLYSSDESALEMLGDTVVGPQDAQKVAVLIHGFTGSNLENLYLANRLARSGIRVYLPLLPGHGTDYEDLVKYRAKDWIAKVSEVLQYVRKVHQNSQLFLLGHSLGGPIAVCGYFKSKIPVNGLVILASPFRYPAMIRWRAKLFRRFSIKIPFAGFKFTDSRLYKNGLVSYFDRKYSYIYIKSAADAVDVMDWAYGSFPKIKIPTLLLYSRIDYRVPLDQAELVKKRIHHAKLKIFDQGNHVLQIDSDRKLVAETILNWIIQEQNISTVTLEA